VVDDAAESGSYRRSLRGGWNGGARTRQRASGRFRTAAQGRFGATSALSSLHLRRRDAADPIRPGYYGLVCPQSPRSPLAASSLRPSAAARNIRQPNKLLTRECNYQPAAASLSPPPPPPPPPPTPPLLVPFLRRACLIARSRRRLSDRGISR